jgi:hypothetical protein
MANANSESKQPALRLIFDRRIKRQFHGARISSDGGMLVYRELEHRSLTTLREKLVKIGARIVRHGRHVVFQLAELAVPRVFLIQGPGHRHAEGAARDIPAAGR